MRTFSTVCLIALLVGCSPHKQEADPVQQDARPNILLIIADDMGYSDLGIYGSEINTPNLDALARSGVQLTNFHASPSCSPTRTRILSGTDNHLAGMGAQVETRAPTIGQPGYEGYLNFRVAPMPELLADAGYHTYMTGKWHLGYEPEQLPSARGFEKTFALLGGAAGQLDDMSIYGPKDAGSTKARYRENGKVAWVPADFYSTRFYTEKLIEFIDSQKDDGKPFFGYLAYTAPHWPLQAPEESIRRNKGKYDQGYDVLYAERIARMEELGLIKKDTRFQPRRSDITPWENLSDEHKRIEARKMEIYAAMVEDMDSYVGRLLDYLKEIEEYDNTLVFFMSDNGPDSSHILPEFVLDWFNECCDNSFDNMGRKGSWIFYGPGWARTSAAHLRGTKGDTSEGGILVPAFVSYPKIRNPGTRNAGFATVMDLLPTFLELAKTEHPGTQYKGREVLTVQGESLWPMLSRTAGSFHADDYLVGWEALGWAAVRQGNWKLLLDKPPRGTADFQLYNLAEDPGEFHDLAQQNPGKYADMKALWKRYQRDNGIIEVTPRQIIQD